MTLKRFFLFTLMMLFATGCFIVGPLHAQSDSDYPVAMRFSLSSQVLHAPL